MKSIHSYRSEVHTILASQLFLKTYAEYFNIEINNIVISYCDNEAYEERLTKYIEELYLTQGLFKRTEQEAYRILLHITPPNFKIINIHENQDENKQYKR